MMHPVNEFLIEAVLRLVESVPKGRVSTYGQIGRIAGIGPRVVGRIMVDWGATVPWWRVVNAAGRLPVSLRETALAHWQGEEVALKRGGDAVDLRGAGVSDEWLDAHWQRINSELGGAQGPTGE